MKIIKSSIAAAISAVICMQAGAQQLEEVVVTAQKRAESLQDVPVAVTALGGADIEALGWDRPNDVAAQVPNMQVSSPIGDVQPLFAIRGISMVDYTPSQASPIGVYMDEGYLGASYLHGMAQFDLERIEVLRGPQGTLYGKNTTGGAVNIITRNPEIDAETSGYAKAGLQNYSGNSFEGAVESTLIDGKLAGRVAVKRKSVDGYWENDAGPDMAETNFESARVTLVWEPTDTFAAVLKHTYGDSDAKSIPPRIDATLGAGVIPEPITVAGRTTNNERHGGSVDYAGDTKVNMNITNLKLDWDLGDYSLVSVTTHYDADYLNQQDTDGTSASLLAIDWASETSAFSQDLRIVSNFDGGFNFIAGVYYGEEDIDTDILHHKFFGDPAVGPVLTQFSNALASSDPALSSHLGVLATTAPQMGMVDRRFDVEKESFAIYTDMSLDINERLGVTLGLRYTEDKNTRDFINYSRLDSNGNPVGSWLPNNILSDTFIALGIDSPFVTAGLAQQTPFSGGEFLDGPYTTESGEVRSVTERATTGKLAVNYHVGDNTMVYASYSKGFRSGSFNNGLIYADQANENGAYVEPEYVDAYELGFKSEFFDGMVRLNGAYFMYDYEDQQFVTQVGVSASLFNAGGADIQGFELEMLAAPIEGLTLQAGLGWLDAEYTELEMPRLATLDPLDTIDLKGNTPVNSPEWNFNFMVNYEFSVTENWYSSINVNGTYTGDQWFSAYNGDDGHQDLKQDSYWLFNARWTIAEQDDRIAVSAWVNNILDEEYDVYAVNLQGGFGYNYFLEGKPQSYGIDVTYRF